MSESQTDQMDFVTLTAEIVGAYVSRNHVQVAEISKLIADVHVTLSTLGSASGGVEQSQAKATSLEIRRSVNPDYLVSFEDGKRYKTLRRHLTLRGLTAEEYRAKWGLPYDYPMTSATYSQRRSELAHSLGLGQQRRKGAAVATTEAAPVAPQEGENAPKGARGRPRKDA